MNFKVASIRTMINELEMSAPNLPLEDVAIMV